MPISPDELERLLGSDLLAAVQALELSLVAVSALAGEGYPGYRPHAYRLETADGRVLKGRVLSSAVQAEHADYVAGALPAGVVPAALMRCGAALITEWAEGLRPEGSRCTPSLLRECGRLQATVHLQPIPEREQKRARGRLRWRTEQLRKQVGDLIAAGALVSDEAEPLLALARQHAPETAIQGFTFGDFCPENAIVRDSGEVCFIDHEALAIDHCDYDLARTWYRWPMTAEQRTAYLEGYAARRPIAAFLAHFPFWAISALLAGAVFRQRQHPQAATVPAGRLRALLADLERGIRPED